MLLTEHQPDYVVTAGDWHANTAWAASVLRMLPELLPEQSPRIIVHAGDFGVWRTRHGEAYLNTLDASLVRKDAIILFVDGNHEDWPLLHEIAGEVDPQQPVAIRNTIWWLPRGYRWTWHGRTWLAVGGAVSVDRSCRREGVDWFPEEEITEAQHRRITAAGRADVMICHDTPIRVPLRLPPPPRHWAAQDLARSDRHRERLQDIVDVVRPTHLIHGHYHLEHDTTVHLPHGPVVVTGLDMDGVSSNFRVLDVRTMTFAPTAAFHRR
jgi:hypothetical protein